MFFSFFYTYRDLEITKIKKLNFPISYSDPDYVCAQPQRPKYISLWHNIKAWGNSGQKQTASLFERFF